MSLLFTISFIFFCKQLPAVRKEEDEKITSLWVQGNCIFCPKIPFHTRLRTLKSFPVFLSNNIPALAWWTSGPILLCMKYIARNNELSTGRRRTKRGKRNSLESWNLINSIIADWNTSNSMHAHAADMPPSTHCNGCQNRRWCVLKETYLFSPWKIKYYVVR